MIALTRQGIDPDAGTVRVRAGVAELRRGKRIAKLPKSKAGVRTVAVPEVILPSLRQHLDVYAEPGRDGRVFREAKGAIPRQHATEERRRTIAGALNERIIDGMKRGPGRNGPATGTAGE